MKGLLKKAAAAIAAAATAENEQVKKINELADAAAIINSSSHIRRL